ncbi:hypothetical protein KUF57_11660 [Mycolicibacterium sp. PAM1]|uniref:Uncharacterized protein n=1 Tax=Mycolicibacterium iranicum TaxID=912594 RepID=A0A1X1WFL2_MYCIR|nr:MULTISPECIES: hypothetical protein [Mycolicibacterium]MBV5244192.1 hypothetical protein [Mycolicibacterium sp. PAM1]ORV85328.1 hypothetical protein AWC12_20650 [Mycolicibacterium iranicum]
MLHQIRYADGRVVELEEPSKSSIELIGDVGVPSPVICRHLNDDGQPNAELTFEVWRGIPVCTGITLSAKREAGTHVRAKDLKSVAAQLEDDIEEWISYLAHEPQPAPPGRRRWVRRTGPGGASHRQTVAKRALRTARKEVRRTMTPEHHQRVADIYNAATSARTEAVARAFTVSYRTAQRYIEKAREADLLDG